MRYSRGIATVTWTLVLIATFAAGIAAGVYYHREISVWLAAAGLRQPASTPSEINIQNTLPTDSFLTMNTLQERLPLVYSDTLEEEAVQQYLKQGAVVLPLGTMFGDPGNVVVTAHSSGSESFGPYRFAFAKLSELENGNEFTITTPEASYTYRAYAKEIVWPHEVDKLPDDDRSTVTLVTCWPLWTNFKRLLVHGELISTEQPNIDITES